MQFASKLRIPRIPRSIFPAPVAGGTTRTLRRPNLAAANADVPRAIENSLVDGDELFQAAAFMGRALSLPGLLPSEPVGTRFAEFSDDDDAEPTEPSVPSHQMYLLRTRR